MVTIHDSFDVIVSKPIMIHRAVLIRVTDIRFWHDTNSFFHGSKAPFRSMILYMLHLLASLYHGQLIFVKPLETSGQAKGFRFKNAQRRLRCSLWMLFISVFCIPRSRRDLSLSCTPRPHLIANWKNKHENRFPRAVYLLLHIGSAAPEQPGQNVQRMHHRSDRFVVNERKLRNQLKFCQYQPNYFSIHEGRILEQLEESH